MTVIRREFGPGHHISHTGHRPSHHQAHGNDRRHPMAGEEAGSFPMDQRAMPRSRPCHAPHIRRRDCYAGRLVQLSARGSNAPSLGMPPSNTAAQLRINGSAGGQCDGKRLGLADDRSIGRNGQSAGISRVARRNVNWLMAGILLREAGIGRKHRPPTSNLRSKSGLRLSVAHTLQMPEGYGPDWESRTYAARPPITVPWICLRAATCDLSQAPAAVLQLE